MAEKGDLQVNWTPGTCISDDQYESLIRPNPSNPGPCEERTPLPNSISNFNRQPLPAAPVVTPANNSIFKRN